MSGPLQSLANPMSTYNTSRQFIQAERDRTDAERRTRVNKEYEKALSSSSESESESECKCECKAKKLTPEQIAYRQDLMKRLEAFDKKCREDQEAFHRELDKGFSCTIL